MGDEALGLLTIFLMFGTPLMIAVLVFAGWMVHTGRKNREVERSREAYERLAREKLDVIKTAIAMGQSDDQIDELDRRLERLLGADKLQNLLNPKKPAPPETSVELRDSDLVAEVDRSLKTKEKE